MNLLGRKKVASCPSKGADSSALRILRLQYWLCLTFLLVALGGCFERGSAKESRSEGTETVNDKAAQPDSIRGKIRTGELTGQVQRNASIAIALTTDPLHLNPLLAGDPVAVQIALGDIYEALLAQDKPGKTPHLGLASGFTHSDDGKTWSFKLRTGVAFQDGSILSAKDVVTSFSLAQNAAGPLQSQLDDLLRIEVDENGQIVFQFSEQRPSRIEVFAAVPIVSAAYFKGTSADALPRAKASQVPMGTGPLRFVSRDKGVIVLQRFTAYWGTASLAERIAYHILPDRNHALAKFRAGVIDILYRLPTSEALANSDKLANGELFEESLPAYVAAVFNTERPRLPAALRRGLRGSIDVDSVIAELFSGYAHKAVGPYLPGSLRADPTIHWSQTPWQERVRALGTQLAGNSLQLEVLVPLESTTMKRLADIWSADLRGIITLRVSALPFAEMLTKVQEGDFDITLLSFTTSSSVDLFSLFHSRSLGNGNLSRLQDPLVDSLLEKYREGKGGLVVSQQLHARLHSLAPFAFLTTDVRLGIVRRDVGGVGDGVPAWGARRLWRRK